MEDITFSTIKEKLEKLQIFVSNTVTENNKELVRDQLENIEFLSNAVNAVAAQGEEVKEEVASLVDDEINQLCRHKAKYSCTPTFIIGFRRSGTTLLSAILDSHSKFGSVPENYMAGISADSEELFNLSKIAFRMETPPDLFWANYTKTIDECYQRFLTLTGKNKERWVSKEFFTPQRLSKLDYIFGYQSKFIYLVRHGFDVSYSCAKRFPERGVFAHLGNLLPGYLDEWTEANELTLEFAQSIPDRCHIIRYENLVNEPVKELNRLFEFLGEDFEPEIFERMRTEEHPGVTGDHKIYATDFKIRNDKGVNWKNWPEPLQNRLFNIAGNTLQKLGYERS
jgi:hypothetical protein